MSFCKRHVTLGGGFMAVSWRFLLATCVKFKTLSNFSHVSGTVNGRHVCCVISLTWKFNRKAIIALLAILQLFSHNQYVILRAVHLHFGHTPAFTNILEQLFALRLCSAEFTYADHEKYYFAVWTQYSCLL